MSRLFQRPIPLPPGVELHIADQQIVVKGKQGELQRQRFPGISLRCVAGHVHLQRERGAVIAKPRCGLYRALLRNMLIGVADGFSKQLLLVGVGFRAAITGSRLDLQVGFSHPVLMEIPPSLRVTVEKSVTITICGPDKQEVGQFAAAIRQICPPEPYKGKGIRYQGEKIRKKAVKAAKGK